MACSKTKPIDEIDDIFEIVQVMKALSISWKGLKTLDEMKARVKTALDQSTHKPNWTAGQVRNHSWTSLLSGSYFEQLFSVITLANSKADVLLKNSISLN